MRKHKIYSLNLKEDFLSLEFVKETALFSFILILRSL